MRPWRARVGPILLILAAAAAQAADAPGGLGPPGMLWGRLAVEEESPDGPRTPLVGVGVSVYPYAPGVLADLEQIRSSARDSVTQFESAVARVQERLRLYGARLRARGEPARSSTPARVGGPTSARGPDGGLVRREETDTAGVFVFENLPSGEWLLVATRIVPYPPAAGNRIGAEGRAAAFLPRSARGPAREAEVWVTRVRVGPSAPTRLFLTDRSRWLVGPLR